MQGFLVFVWKKPSSEAFSNMKEDYSYRDLRMEVHIVPNTLKTFSKHSPGQDYEYMRPLALLGLWICLQVSFFDSQGLWICLQVSFFDSRGMRICLQVSFFDSSCGYVAVAPMFWLVF